MGDDVTMLRRVSLVGRLYKMIPGEMAFILKRNMTQLTRAVKLPWILRESIPRLFNGGKTTMTTHCAPACSQALPVKPQGGLGQRYWSVSRVTWPPKSGVSEVGVSRALQPNDISGGPSTFNIQGNREGYGLPGTRISPHDGCSIVWIMLLCNTWKIRKYRTPES